MEDKIEKIRIISKNILVSFLFLLFINFTLLHIISNSTQENIITAYILLGVVFTELIVFFTGSAIYTNQIQKLMKELGY